MSLKHDTQRILDDAEEIARIAREIDPAIAIIIMTGHTSEEHLRQAVQLDPALTAAHESLVATLVAAGRLVEAAGDHQAAAVALQRQPGQRPRRAQPPPLPPGACAPPRPPAPACEALGPSPHQAGLALVAWQPKPASDARLPSCTKHETLHCWQSKRAGMRQRPHRACYF